MLTFGDRLRMARERKGLSQLEVFKLTNISNKSLSKYEKNIASPDPEIIKTLIKTYDVSADFIMGFSDSMGQTYSSNETIKSKNIKDLSPDDAEILKKLESLSPEAKEKAADYVEMLKALQEVKNSSNVLDFKEKA